MKKVFGVMVLCMVLSVPFASFAGGVWTPYGQVLTIFEYGLGMRVKGLDYSANPAGCPQWESGILYSGLTDTQIDRISEIILSAFLSGREVSLKMSNGACESENPAIYAVQVH